MLQIRFRFIGQLCGFGGRFDSQSFARGRRSGIGLRLGFGARRGFGFRLGFGARFGSGFKFRFGCAIRIGNKFGFGVFFNEFGSYSVRDYDSNSVGGPESVGSSHSGLTLVGYLDSDSGSGPANGSDSEPDWAPE